MANAVFSFSTALLMFFDPVLVGGLLGIQAPQILQFVGIGLAIFATELIDRARSQRVATWRALLASAADFSWVIGSIFAVRFRSEAANFPFPAKTMRGGWEVISSDVGSQVMVWWELKLHNKLLAPLILPLLAFQVDRDFPKIVARMAATAILEQNSNVTMPLKEGVFARLLPIFC
jgi:hypothetical protein